MIRTEPRFRVIVLVVTVPAVVLVLGISDSSPEIVRPSGEMNNVPS